MSFSNHWEPSINFQKRKKHFKDRFHFFQTINNRQKIDFEFPCMFVAMKSNNWNDFNWISTYTSGVENKISPLGAPWKCAQPQKLQLSNVFSAWCNHFEQLGECLHRNTAPRQVKRTIPPGKPQMKFSSSLNLGLSQPRIRANVYALYEHSKAN